jgi:hypothetical protein
MNKTLKTFLYVLLGGGVLYFIYDAVTKDTDDGSQTDSNEEDSGPVDVVTYDSDTGVATEPSESSEIIEGIENQLPDQIPLGGTMTPEYGQPAVTSTDSFISVQVEKLGNGLYKFIPIVNQDSLANANSPFNLLTLDDLNYIGWNLGANTVDSEQTVLPTVELLAQYEQTELLEIQAIFYFNDPTNTYDENIIPLEIEFNLQVVYSLEEPDPIIEDYVPENVDSELDEPEIDPEGGAPGVD